MNGVQGSETLQWKVGLINHLDKYMTAETFGFKVNASGSTMRKKQLWVIEQDSVQENVVYIKTHLNRYISADKKGNISAANETVDETCKFTVHYDPSGSGKWAFQNLSNMYFFGATEDKVLCYEKTPTKSEWWTIRLAVHPQVNIRNVNRKKYVHLSADGKLQCNELLPWGCDALITLEFNKGKYSIRSSAGSYLSKNGSLVPDSNDPDTHFTLEIRSAGIAFKDNDGKYLMGVGRDAVLQSKTNTVGKDQMFTLEDSHPQVFITAHNGKKASIKQGVDVTANQEELTDKETFQVEFDKKKAQWRFRADDSRYWCLMAASGIQAVGNNSSETGLFSIEYLDDGHVALKASNDKYVNARQNGSLFAVSDSVGDKENFIITVMNRPILVLKCDYGFVGFKSPGNPRLECNKASLDYIHLEPYVDGNMKGRYQLKGHNGLYWSVDGEHNINADSPEPKPFRLEMQAQSRFAIKAPNGNYIKGEQNGIFSATAKEVGKDTLWEY